MSDMKKGLPSLLAAALTLSLALAASASTMVTFEAARKVFTTDHNKLYLTCFARLSFEERRLAVRCDEQGASDGAVAEVLRKYTDRLMAMEGVVMVAQGEDEVGRDCIIVGVKTAKYLHTISKTIEGVHVHARVIGEVDAL
jgi:hypothetical protein